MRNVKTMLFCGIALAALTAPFICTTEVSAAGNEIQDSSVQLVNGWRSNLITNGDFNNGLDYWENYAFNGATVSIKTEEEENYVELTNPNKDSGSLIVQTISSSQLKEYSVSFWYKGSNNGRFVAEANAGGLYHHFPIVNLSDSQKEWKEYKGTIIMPEDIDESWPWTELTIAFNNGEKGEDGNINPLCIKNVQLVEIK